MTQATDHEITLALLEFCLTTIAVALAFCWPGIGSGTFSWVESLFSKLAHRKGISVITVGLTALLLRVAILPICPIPLPFIPDDFSFLLAAETFASGRLTNPTPAMWAHFETIHETMYPTYMSMYFPAQGLILAAAKVLTGQPWVGVLVVGALMCAAICWMLQAWLPPTWALLGGMIAILRLAMFSYWMNTYSAGGSIAALGGALVLGSLLRLVKTVQTRYGLLMAVGMALLMMTRPYEGMLLCLPVAIYLIQWICVEKNAPSWHVLIKRAAMPLVLLVAVASWMGYYDYCAFGSPLRLPYTVDRAEYAMAPYYVWQSPKPEPHYRHAEMRHFYYVNEMGGYTKIHNLRGFLPETMIKLVRSFEFYAGIVLLIPMIMLRRVLLDRRIRFLVLCCLLLACGMVIEIFLIPHYLAPFTSAFYAIGLQAMRHLRLWTPGGQSVGLALVRLIMVLCVVLAGMRLYAGPLHLHLVEWPPSAWTDQWYGPDHFGTARAEIESKLEHSSGKQLVIVRYSSEHNPIDEWVYNAANIDGSKVVWAREMDSAENETLVKYYKDRHVWLVQPDLKPASVMPYPLNELVTAH